MSHMIYDTLNIRQQKDTDVKDHTPTSGMVGMFYPILQLYTGTMRMIHNNLGRK